LRFRIAFVGTYFKRYYDIGLERLVAITLRRHCGTYGRRVLRLFYSVMLFICDTTTFYRWQGGRFIDTVWTCDTVTAAFEDSTGGVPRALRLAKRARANVCAGCRCMRTFVRFNACGALPNMRVLCVHIAAVCCGVRLRVFWLRIPALFLPR